jgi:hypothetical protein
MAERATAAFPPPLRGRVSPRSGDGWGGVQERAQAPAPCAIAPRPLPVLRQGEDARVEHTPYTEHTHG